MMIGSHEFVRGLPVPTWRAWQERGDGLIQSASAGSSFRSCHYLVAELLPTRRTEMRRVQQSSFITMAFSVLGISPDHSEFS